MRDRYLWCKELVSDSYLISAHPSSSSTQMCALVHLFHLGVLHSDIKPANVLISHTGAAVLTDFGNAKEVPVYDYATWKGYSRDGTCPYMAPEMVSADVHSVGYGTGVDVWSMGLVFMEIIGFCDGPFFHQRTLEGIQYEHTSSGRLPIDPDKFLCADEKFWEILPAVCAFYLSVMVLLKWLTHVADVAGRSEEADHCAAAGGEVRPDGRMGFGP